jgi:uncharacterized repeat protein (TIGR01451 family)
MPNMTEPLIGRSRRSRLNRPSRLASAAALSVSAVLLACLVWLPAPTAAQPAGGTLAGGVVVTQVVGTGPGGAGVVYNGDQITYTIVISNNGASAATNILVIDALPPDALDGISCDGGCERIAETTVFPEPTGGTVAVTVTRSISWTLDSLPPGGGIRKTVTGRVTGQPDGTVITNRAFLSYSDGNPSSEVQTTVRVRIEQTGQSVLSPVPTWFSKDLGGTISQDWGDFDRDGNLDLALASSVGLGVYRNESGRLVKFWSDPRQAYGVAWGDFLGTGKLALVAVGDSTDDSPSSTGLNYVYQQRGPEFVQTGVFTSDYQLVRVVAGDFRDSGNIDLIASTNAINSSCPVRLYRNDGAGNFQTGPDDCVSTSATAALSAADFNNDGFLDLALGLFPHRAQVLINNGAGRFTNYVPLDDYLTFLPYDLKWGDYDGDGFLDLAAAFPMQREARVYHNRQGTGFDPPIIIHTQLFWTPLTVDWADFHGAGRMDLAVADSPPGIYQYQGGAFHLTSHLAADSVSGRIWSLRGVRILPDGDLNLSVSNRDGPSLLFDGFSPHLSENILPVDAAPASGVAWGDANGDGTLDLLLGAGSPPAVGSRVYYNTNGVITNVDKSVLVPSGLGPHSVSFADVNTNGSLDIAIGGAGETQIYLAGQTNPFWSTSLPDAKNHVVAWADADNNGTLDLLTAGYGDAGRGSPIVLFLNGAGGIGGLGTSPAFTSVVTGNVTSLAWCDFDKDGFPDFAVGNDGQPSRVFHNNRDNTFSLIWNSGFTSRTTSIACADFNADTYPDLALGTYQQGTVVFENIGGSLSAKPIWTSPTLSKTTSIAWGDWNNDGYPELAIGNDGEPDQVFANLASSAGAPRLFWTWTSRETNATTGVAWGDFNGDGYLDLATSQNGGGQSGIYQNTTVRPAHLSDVFTPTMLLPKSPSYVWIQRPGQTDDGYLNSAAEILSGPANPTVTIHYRVFNPDGSRVLAASNVTGTAIARTYFEYSVDGGSTWRRASRAAGSSDAITQTTRLGLDGVFQWDAVADQAISDNARFRVRVVDGDRAGPVQRAATSAVSPPFRVRGTSCTWPENPRIYYYPINPPPNAPVNFIGTVDAGSGALAFVWDFGDGGDFGFGQTIQHTFAQSAMQVVTLTVTGEACPINRERVATTLVAVGIGVPEYRIYMPLIANNATFSATDAATGTTTTTGSLTQMRPLRSNGLRVTGAPPAWAGSSIPTPAGMPVKTMATLGASELTPPGSPCSLTKVSGFQVGISDQPAGNATGSRVAFWSTADLTGNNRDGSIEIFVADSDATGVVTYTQVTSSTGSVLGGFNFSPSLDRAGRRLAFYTERDLTGGNQDGNFEIFLAEIGTGGAVTISQLTTTTIGANILPSISADGARIAFASDRNLTSKNPDGNSEIVLATVDAAGTITYNVVTKTDGGLNDQPALSSDGTRIAFLSDRDLTGANAGGGQQVFVATLGGSGIVSFAQLTPSASSADGAVGRPAINADGSRIAFASNRNLTGRNPGLTRQIFVAYVDLAGAVTLSMVTDPTLGSYDQPALNSDGTRIAFVSSADQAVMLFDSVINAYFQLTSAGADSFGPAIDSQGTHLAFVANRAVYGASCPLVDLAVSKTAEPASVLAGDGLAYTVVITNQGPSQATNVQLTDELPGQLQEVIPPDQVDDDNSASGFGGGSFHATLWSTATSALQLDAPAAPSPAELPDRRANGFVNMTGNVLLLHLNELAGSRVFTDTSSLGNVASCPVISCPVAGVPGKINRGLSFNGVSNYLAVPNTTTLNFGGRISMAAWVNVTATNGYRTIIGHGPSSSPNREVYLRIKDGYYQAGYRNELGDFPTGFAIPPGDAGAWVHLAGVYDGAAWRLYRNGILVYSTQTLGGAVTVPGNWGIGAAGDGRSGFFNGKLDEVAVWSRDLSSDEVLEIYNRQAPFFGGAAGYFDSRILDARAPVPWQTLSWTPRLPMGKQLLDGGQSESVYPLGNIDMSGNTLLLHFAEPAASTTFSDTSGLGKSAICGPLGCPTAGATGRFGRAVRFNGAGNVLTVMDSANPTAYTLEAWVKPGSSGSGSIIARTDYSGPTSSWSHQLRITAAGKFEHYTNDGNAKSVVGATTVVPGLWYHVAGVAASNGLMHLYVNGQEEGSAIAIGNLVVGRDRWVLGSNSGNSIGYFSGYMDEVAVFNHALPVSAIQDHYLRGALQAKFQVRSCSTVSCTLGSEVFIGPDGTSATYYSEISNTTTALPSIPVSVANNRYFQYRLTLETDNLLQAPQIQQVAVGPSHRAIIASQGTCDGIRSISCSLGNIAAGATATVTVISQVAGDARGEIINSADARSAETERNHANNASTVSTRILADTDLAVSQTTDVPVAVAGLPYSYTVTVTNNGPKPATSVIVRGLLPDGSSLAYSPPECSYDGFVLACQLAGLPAGSSWTLPLVVNVWPETRGAITNTVGVESLETDPNSGNNSSVAVSPVLAIADLSVVTAAADDVIAGTPLTYTLSIGNRGPSLATGIIVTDSLSPSATQVITSSAPFTRTGNVVTWTVGSLAPSAEITISLAVTVNGSARGVITNWAGITATESDPDLHNNLQPRDTVAFGIADLVAEKLVSSSNLTVGQPLTYTLLITNSGPSDALGAVLTDTLPASVTLNSVLPAAYTCTPSSGRLVCALGTILARETATLTLATTVHAKAPAGVITNSLVVTSSTQDPDPATNSAAASTSLRTMANLGIGKTAPPVVQAGTSLTYSLVVTNTGPSDATSVVVTDTLPSSVAFQSATPGCTAAGPTVRCVLGNLTDAPGANTRGVTITVGVLSSAPQDSLIVNTATVGGAQPDDYPEDNSVVVTTTVHRVTDLALTKSASAEPVLAGAALTYTLSLTNSGPSDASSVVVTDNLPASVAFASASPPCAHASGVVTCPVASLSAGANMVFSVAVTVESSTPEGTLLANASVAGAAEADANAANNSSTITSSVLARADLAVTKWAPATVFAGNQLTYTLAITNNGPSDATAVSITDVLPAGVSLVSMPSGWASSGVTLTGSLGTMVAGASHQFTVTVDVPSSMPAGQTLTNTAVASTATTDPEGTNNSASTATTVQTQADLVIAKHASPDPVFLGNPLTYTVVITNRGPSDAALMVITDVLPGGVTLLSTDASAGTCAPVGGTVTCTLAAPAVPGLYTVTLHTSVTAISAGYLTNTAGVSSTTFDPDPANSVVLVTTLAQTQADLSIAKAASTGTVSAGEYLTYTLTITNANAHSVNGVVVTDELPISVTAASLPAACTTAGSAIRCDVGTLDATSSQVIVLPVRVDPAALAGQVTNTASITSTTNRDPLPTNNSASASVTVQRRADLSVSKSVHPDLIMQRQPLSYTITVTNAGPSRATGVTLTDTLPADVHGPEMWTSQGACGGSSVITCNLDYLDPLGTAQVVITATVNSGAREITNTVQVAGAEQDPDPSHNAYTLASTVQQADLSISKTASTEPVYLGSVLTYTLTITNNGPHDATGVAVTDTLPVSFTFASASAGCALSGGDVVCNLGNVLQVSPLNTRAITIAVSVPTSVAHGAILTNTAIVEGLETDPVPADNTTVVATSVIRRTDLSLSKSASGEPIVAGRRVTYTLSVGNAGPDPASGVTVTDSLSTAVSFVSASSGCALVGGAVTCGIGDLSQAPGQNTRSITVAVSIPVTAVDGSLVVNRASETGNETDGNPVNNSSTVTSTVARRVDVLVAKTASSSTVVAGSVLTYTVGVTNTGPSQASGVTITDTLPAGMAFSAASGPYNRVGNAITWTVGGLAPATAATYSLSAVADPAASGMVTNTAYVTATETDTQPANNSASAAATIQGVADVGVEILSVPDTVLQDQSVTFVITTTNHGPGVATGVVLTHVLPTNLSSTSYSVDRGSCTGTGTLVCSFGTLSGNATATLTLTGTVAHKATQLVNHATVSANELDFGPAPNDVTLTTLARQADMAVTKSASAEPVAAGAVLTYSLSITNSTSSHHDATNVVVQDQLPVSVSFLGASNSCTNVYGAVNCNLGTISHSSNNTRLVTITVSVPATATIGSSLVNTASVDASETDTNSANNSSTITSTVSRSADLAVTKTASSSTVTAGTQLTYTLAVTNNGPSQSSGFTLTDTMPVSTSFASSSVSPSARTGRAITWTLSALDTGAAVTVSMVVTIDAASAEGPITNRAGVTGNEADPAPGNNLFSLNTNVVRQVDLAVAKTTVAGNAVAGATLTYTLAVTNSGLSQASGVVLTDTIPISTSFAWSSSTPAARSGRDIAWTLPALNPGANVTVGLAITVDAAASGDLVNAAGIAANETDVNLTNNYASASSPVTRQTNLTLTGSTSGAAVSVGHSLTYTLVSSNTGPSQATSVMVSGTLPTGADFANASGSFAMSGSVITWTVGTLEPQTGVTLTLAVTPTGAASPITNTARLWGAEPDPTAPHVSVLTNTVYTAGPITVTLAGQTSGSAGSTATFTATANVTASFPITFVWSITPTGFITHAGLYRSSDTMSYTWDAAGSTTITATVANVVASLTSILNTATGLILPGYVPSGPLDRRIYLPLVQRTWPAVGP